MERSPFLTEFAEKFSALTGNELRAGDLQPGDSDFYNHVYVNRGFPTFGEAAALLKSIMDLVVDKDVLIRVAPEVSTQVDFVGGKKSFVAYLRYSFRDRPGTFAKMEPMDGLDHSFIETAKALGIDPQEGMSGHVRLKAGPDFTVYGSRGE